MKTGGGEGMVRVDCDGGFATSERRRQRRWKELFGTDLELFSADSTWQCRGREEQDGVVVAEGIWGGDKTVESKGTDGGRWS